MYRHFTYSLAPALAVAFIVIAGAPPAAIAAPPAKADCGSITDVFERAKCRHDAIVGQMEYTADTAFAPGTELHGRTSQAKIDLMINARERGQRSRDRTTPAELRKLVRDEVRGNRKTAHLVPLDEIADDGNGDGICDYEQDNPNALCAAVELDELGELQACNPEKKNKGKGKPGSGKFAGLECDLSFDPQVADEEVEMEQAAALMDETFGAAEDNFIEMNEELDAVNANMSAGSASLRAAASNACDIPTPTPGLFASSAVLRGIWIALKGATAIHKDVTTQTFVAAGFGGNTRSFAIPLDSATLVAELAYFGVDTAVNAEARAKQAKIGDCIIEVGGQVAVVAGQVGDVATQIAALQAAMAAEHGEVRANDNANTAALQARLAEVEAELSRLLNTPHGQREGFPAQ